MLLNLCVQETHQVEGEIVFFLRLKEKEKENKKVCKKFQKKKKNHKGRDP